MANNPVSGMCWACTATEENFFLLPAYNSAIKKMVFTLLTSASHRLWLIVKKNRQTNKQNDCECSCLFKSYWLRYLLHIIDLFVFMKIRFIKAPLVAQAMAYTRQLLGVNIFRHLTTPMKLLLWIRFLSYSFPRQLLKRLSFSANYSKPV